MFSVMYRVTSIINTWERAATGKSLMDLHFTRHKRYYGRLQQHYVEKSKVNVLLLKYLKIE